jgi:hypothetical protein
MRRGKKMTYKKKSQRRGVSGREGEKSGSGAVSKYQSHNRGQHS